VLQNKVVVQYKNKTLKKGSTGDFFPNKATFHLHVPDGETLEIQVEDLKAIFFVKNYEGDKNYHEKYTEVVPGGGRKMRVTFFDGEAMVGYSHGYAPNRPGFFLVPADSKSNNERIFVVKSATQSIEPL
jgi:hypothetical protein